MISRPRITTTLIVLTNSAIGVIGYYIYNLEISQLIIIGLLSLTTTLISYVKGLRAGRLFSVLEFKKDVVKYRNRDFEQAEKEIAFYSDETID